MAHPHRFVAASLLGLVVAACGLDRAPATDAAGSAAAGPDARWAWHPAPAQVVPGATTVLWDLVQQRPRQLVGAMAPPVDLGRDADAAVVARAVLAAHAPGLALETDPADLVETTRRTGLAGTYVRLAQHVGGLPVFEAEVVVLVGRDAGGAPLVRAINLAHAGVVPAAAVRPGADVGAVAALAAARRYLAQVGGGADPEVGAPTVVRGLVVEAGAPRLAYQLELASHRHRWRVVVDATTGQVRSVRDRNPSVDGTGLVFDPDPVASTGNPGLTDDNDADSPALDAARFAVTLPRLDGTGVLRGPWADARSSNAAQRATEAGLDFSYPRSDDRFEEVMAYYHLDRAQARVQALGFTAVNNRVQEAVANAFAADNSFYSSTTKRLEFGRGGVDDGEDGDIILHEYGHSIHDDQVPGWGGGDERSMGEGFGDYFAGSFQGTLGRGVGDPACVGDWDAVAYDTRSPPCLRRLDEPKHWPEDAVGQVHADGELWSGALWRARTVVGADVMDRLVLESHFLLSTNESFASASAALLVADDLLFAGANQAPVRRALYHHGLLRTPRPTQAYSDVLAVDPTVVASPTDGAGTYPADLDDTRTITMPGALAVRVHFQLLDTEAGGGCEAGLCDAVYLFDGAGDLYQILGGAQSGVTSVQVPGDTVRIRLVTDRSGPALGYVIDRAEAMGGAPLPDAGPPDARVDAGIDAVADATVDATVDAGLDAQVDAAVDAAVDTDAGAAIDAATPADATPAGPDAVAGGGDDGDGGCGCRSGADDAGATGLAAVLVVGLVGRRRRRVWVVPDSTRPHP
ncbi:MAG: hypothetical protein KA297_13360 [Kofleriaceae bacterium]|nr:hypothetical protein [Kofleriaceae bacterium]